MPLRFRDLIGRPDEASVASLEAAVARASAAATDASTRLEKLQAERRAALVADDDKACDRLDAEITTATRDRERALEAGLELGARLGQARQREHQAKVDAVHKRGEAARRKAIATIKGDYARHARALVKIAAELEAAQVEIDSTNLALAQAG